MALQSNRFVFRLRTQNVRQHEGSTKTVQWSENEMRFSFSQKETEGIKEMQFDKYVEAKSYEDDIIFHRIQTCNTWCLNSQHLDHQGTRQVLKKLVKFFFTAAHPPEQRIIFSLRQASNHFGLFW